MSLDSLVLFLHLSPLIPIMDSSALFREKVSPKRCRIKTWRTTHNAQRALAGPFIRARMENACVSTVGQCRHGTDNIRTSLEQKRWVALHISSRVSTLASSRFPKFFRLDLPSTSPHPPLLRIENLFECPPRCPDGFSASRPPQKRE